MKFLKFIAIAAMLCATPSVVTATPDDGGYTVHLKDLNGTGHDEQKSGTGAQVECVFYPSDGLLSFYSPSLSTNASVVLENQDTGIVTRTIVHISSLPSSVLVSNDGYYILIITLPDGTEYIGEFILQ